MFHGRGGTETVHASLRVTVQGEVIEHSFGVEHLCFRTRHAAVHGGHPRAWHAPSGLPQTRVPRHHERGGRRGRLECDAPLVGGRRWWSAMGVQGVVRGGGQRNGASSWRRCTAVRVGQRVFLPCDIRRGFFVPIVGALAVLMAVVVFPRPASPLPVGIGRPVPLGAGRRRGGLLVLPLLMVDWH
jgi:hypothetical protein